MNATSLFTVALGLQAPWEVVDVVFDPTVGRIDFQVAFTPGARFVCPHCGAEMKIIAFITEHATVAHILEHIRMPAQRPEPLAHSPPLQEELLCAYAS